MINLDESQTEKKNRSSEQSLQVFGLFVAQVEEAVARVVGVQAELGAERADVAAGAHQEGPAAADAELVLALAAREVHATAARQGELEVALRALDAVLGQMLG